MATSNDVNNSNNKTNTTSNEIPDFVLVILRKIKGFLWLDEFILFKIANIAHTLIQLLLFITFIVGLFGAGNFVNEYFGGYLSYSPSYLYIIFSYILVAVGVRLFFEIMLIIFSINAKLEEIVKEMKK